MANGIVARTDQDLARIAHDRKVSDTVYGAGVGSAVGGFVGLLLGNSTHGAKLGALIGAVAPHFSPKAQHVARSAKRHVAEVFHRSVV